MLARYRSVLVIPGSARLYVTAVLARLPQGMAGLSLLLLVRGATHSYAVAGLAVGVEALATAAAAPVQGRLVDRFGRARVLGPFAGVQAALFVTMVVCAHAGVPGVVLVAIAVGIGASLPAIAPSVRALLRAVVTDETVRESAYALESVVQEIIWITGPLVVAVIIAAASPSTAVVVCAFVTLLGTSLFVASPASRGITPAPRAKGPGVLRTLPELRSMLLPVGLMGFAIGTTEVGIPSLALHVGSRASSGLLLAVWSVGSMVGGLLYGSVNWRISYAERYRRLLAAAVLLSVPLVFARSIPVGLVAALLTGLAIAPVFSCQYALISRVVPEGAETEAFTWVSSALVTGLAAGSALAGAAISDVGVSAPFLLSCVALAISASTAVNARRLARVAV